ncbi:hypothetical protein [Sinorhizobium fredii]|uniref:hypothetical protein n=1 Tax=Rhizobium fredii TaxID=380 RepID=UPI0004BB850A|nr:hypothetical protein [Sinorhizobium fredii]
MPIAPLGSPPQVRLVDVRIDTHDEVANNNVDHFACRTRHGSFATRKPRGSTPVVSSSRGQAKSCDG